MWSVVSAAVALAAVNTADVSVAGAALASVVGFPVSFFAQAEKMGAVAMMGIHFFMIIPP